MLKHPGRVPLFVLFVLLPVGVALVLWKPWGRDRTTVVLISIDSLRADHLGCYGYPRPTSPVLDRLATEGARFETVLSSTSWTLPAHAALFTGLPDRLHGCTDESRWLPGNRDTLAEAFKRAGFQTVGFFSGPFLHPAFGFAQGFDSYHDCTSYSELSIEMFKRNLQAAEMFMRAHADVTNPIVVREVDTWLDAHPDGPAFLFIHLWDVHYDYIPPPPYSTLFTDPSYAGKIDGRLATIEKLRKWTPEDKKQLEALYDGEIRWTDDAVGKLIESLKKHERFEHAVFAVTSDHGEAFFEHRLHGHHKTLFEEEVRIPLILRAPGVTPGTRVSTPVQITDIGPTLLDLAGADRLTQATGSSLRTLLDDPSAPWPHTHLFMELLSRVTGFHGVSIRTKDWKYVLILGPDKWAVFDLTRDPGEQHVLSRENLPLDPDYFDRLYMRTAKQLEAIARRLPTIEERDTPPFSKMSEAQLRALGYLR
jgi:arylsulfatase A-like enzyme